MTAAYPPAGAPSPLPTAISRVQYGQLLYTSFDDASGVGGGWQVKDQNGDLSSEERELLTARVVTKFDVDPGLPQFPTAEQIAARPSRLAYAPLGPGTAAYWHTVDAGNDATGRPGNVMAHIVLDRDIAAPSALRPIQLWESAEWRRPYGPAEVLATSLDVHIPQPNPVITAESVIHFLAGTAVDRQGVFRVLLDAVYAAMAGGPKVVLLTGDNTNGPLWIAAVSFLMSPGTARGLSWTTHAKAPQAVTELRRGMHLVVLPREAELALPAGDWLVLDEAEEPAVRELGSAHNTSRGRVTVTPWSTLAEGVLADEALALRLLGDQDSLAEEVGDRRLSPIWPLAVAVLRRSDLAEFHRDAQHAIAEDAPPHVADVRWLDDLVAEAASATAPATLDEARARLLAAVDRGAGLRHAAVHYLTAALSDRSDDNDPIAGIPTVRVLAPPDWEPALERVWAQAAASDSDVTGQTLRRLLIGSELLVRLAQQGLAVEHALSTSAHHVTPVRLDLLYGTAAPDIVAGMSGVSTTVRDAVLRPALAASQTQRDLRAVPLAVWHWVFSDENTPVEQQGAASANPSSADRVLYPWYVHALLSGPRVQQVPEAWRRETAGHAVFTALDSESLSDQQCRELVADLLTHAALDATEIADMFNRWPQRVSPGAAVSTVLCKDCPPELLTAIASSSLDTADTDNLGRCAIAGARLRRLAIGPAGPHAYTDAVTAAAPVLVARLSVSGVDELRQDLVDVLIAACIAAQAEGQEWVQAASKITAALGRRIDHAGGSTASAVLRFIDAGVIDAGWVAGESFLGRFGDALGAQALLGRPANRRRDNALGDEIVAMLIKRRTYDGPRDAAGLRDNAWRRVRKLEATQAEEFFSRYAKLAKEWLHDHRL